MGEIAARLADVLVVTDDNPRTEDPAAIRAEVLAGTRRRHRRGPRGRRPRAGDPHRPGPGRPRRHRAGRRQGTRARPGDRRRGASLRRPRGRPRGARGASDDRDDHRRDRRRRRGSGRTATRIVTGPAFFDSRVGRARWPLPRGRRASASTATSTPRARSPRAPPRCSGPGPPGCRPWWSTTRWSRSACWPATSGTGCPDLTVIALTGSQGKTGTKDYLAQVLATAGETVATAGNLNNEIGVPVTVLRASATTRFLVVEMGARGIGHIAYLCGIARPTIAGVLNVGTAHLGEFGSREAIARAKGEILEGLPADGVAVLNADDDADRGDGRPDRRTGADLRRRGGADLALVRRPVRRPRSTHRRAHARGWPYRRASRCARSASTSSRTPPPRPRSRSPSDSTSTRWPTASTTRSASRGGGWRCTTGRRERGHQRRLQRQPRLDARRDRDPGPDRHPPRRPDDRPCSVR